MIAGVDFASVGIDDGFADAQTDSHSFVPVSGMVIRRASPVKNRIQQFGGNALAVIFDGDRKTAFPGGSHQVNGPVGAGMEQGIFQKVIDNLFYQGCIHGYYDDGVGNDDPHLDIREPFPEPLHGFGYDLFQGFVCLDHGGHAFFVLDSGD